MTSTVAPILFASTRPIWPCTAGFAIRSHGTWSACQSVHQTATVLIAPSDEKRELPPGSPQTSIAVTGVERMPPWTTVVRWIFGKNPWSWCRIDWSAATPAIARQFSDSGASLLFVSGIDGWAAVPIGLRPHTIIDVDDIESAKLEHRLGQRRTAYRGLLGAVLYARDRVDLRRWTAIERDIAGEAAKVVVCSEADRRLINRDPIDVFAVPNIASEESSRAVARTRPPANPTLLFVGSLTTRPNEEACRFLVEQVMPHIWELAPAATARLVGRASPMVQRLAGDRVIVTGFTEDLAAEFTGASIVVAPFVSGGGTRIKILEAFWQQIPVVTTTVGGEGLDIENGVHALIRDDPKMFAEACLSVLADASLAGRLCGRGRSLVEGRYSQRAMNEAVRRTLLSAGAPSQG